MENLVEKIVQMDEQAQRLAQEVQSTKLELEKEVTQIHREIYEQHLLGAKQRIEKLRISEEAKADELWKSIEKKQAKRKSSLLESARTHKDEWVERIVQDVLTNC